MLFTKTIGYNEKKHVEVIMRREAIYNYGTGS